MKRLVALMVCAVSLGAAAQLPDYVPTDGLVGWWPFNGTLQNVGSNGDEGLAYDGAEGIAYGTTYGPDRFSNSGAALQIGLGSYAYLGLDFALQLTSADTLTISFWSKPDQDESVTLTKYQNFNQGSSWFVGNSWSQGVRAYGDGTSGTLNESEWSSACPNSTDGWAHAVIVYRGGMTSTWVNGVAICEIINPVSSLDQNQPVLVGRSNCSDGSPCNYSSGQFDDLGFWTRALSTEEIMGLYLAEGPIAGCVDEEACNFNLDAVIDDESCHFLCEYCIDGTIWNEELQGCVHGQSADINNDGCVQLNDLLDLLTAYGDCGAEDSAWQCGDPLEYQGYDYETVQIGEQCWFAENLRAENYRNGEAIQTNLGDSEWEVTTTGAVTVYEEEAVNLEVYGRLYNWYAVADVYGLCPTGWHVPEELEWQDLLVTAGGADMAGEILKSQDFWAVADQGNDALGFDGRPGGFRYYSGAYQTLGANGYWWTSNTVNDDQATIFELNSDDAVATYPDLNIGGFSVRCIKDTE